MPDARPKKPPKPQANAFKVAKQNALSKLDKSPKGSLDQPIAALVFSLNRHADFVTTSSCSGRIVLFEGARAGRGGKWLLVSHATVTVEDVTSALAVADDAVGAAAAAAAEDAAATADAAAADAGDEASTSYVALKMEPAILHVQCRDLSSAKWLLQVALRAGFRESGLVLSESSSKTMLAIRTTSNCLELPVAVAGRAGAPRELLVSDDFLRLLVSQANAKFAANAARVDALQAAFESAAPSADAAACAECDPADAPAADAPAADVDAAPNPEPPAEAAAAPAAAAAVPAAAAAPPSPPGRDDGDGDDDDGGAAAAAAAADAAQRKADAALRRYTSRAAQPCVRHYCNLTNGVEAVAPLMWSCGVPRESLRFTRLQSSHCENRDYMGVLSALDHDLLLHLALGYTCRVYDFGSRRKRWPGQGLELMVPSAIWWGLEVARYALTRLWQLPAGGGERGVPGYGDDGGGGGEAGGRGGPGGGLGMLHGHDASATLDKVLRTLPKSLSRKLRYYRPFVATEVVRLEGVFAPTENDGQTLALARRLWWSYSLGFRPDEDATVWLLEMQLEEAQLKRQPPLPPGMQPFDAVAFGLAPAERPGAEEAPAVDAAVSAEAREQAIEQAVEAERARLEAEYAAALARAREVYAAERAALAAALAAAPPEDLAAEPTAIAETEKDDVGGVVGAGAGPGGLPAVPPRMAQAAEPTGPDVLGSGALAVTK